MAITDLDPRFLVESCKRGDDEAFAEIVRRHHESLFGHAVRRLGGVHAAEDAVQETFVRAYRAMPSFDGDFRLQAWLHRILTNVCHDEGRRRQRESDAVERVAGDPVNLTDGPAADEGVEHLSEAPRQVLDALATLPESYRQALTLRYVDELSFSQMAVATGTSEGNARVRVHRGRAALRRAMGSALGLLAFLIPVLRRSERIALAEPSGRVAEATVAATQAAPAISRVAETSSIFADKSHSIAAIVAVTAGLIVPAAAPSAVQRFNEHRERPRSDQVSSDATGEGAAVATGGARRASGSKTAAAAGALADDKPATAAADEVAAPAPTASSPSSSTPPSEEEPPPSAGAPVATPATRLAAVLDATDLSAVGDETVHLSGGIRMRVGDDEAVGSLQGTLTFDDGGAEEEGSGSAAGETGDGATDESDSETSSGASTSSSTSEPPPEEPTASSTDDEAAAGPGSSSAPPTVSGELFLSIEGAQTFRVVIDGTLERLSDGTSATTGTYTVFDECGAEQVTREFSGAMRIESAPVASSMHLDLSEFAADDTTLRRPASC